MVEWPSTCILTGAMIEWFKLGCKEGEFEESGESEKTLGDGLLILKKGTAFYQDGGSEPFMTRRVVTVPGKRSQVSSSRSSRHQTLLTCLEIVQSVLGTLEGQCITFKQSYQRLLP